MTKGAKMRAKARKEAIPKLIAVLQTRRAFQNATVGQIKAAAKQMAMMFTSLRLKEIKAEQLQQPNEEVLKFMKLQGQI